MRNGPPGDRDLGIEEPRGKPAAGRVHDHAFDLHPSHALRRVDGETDGSFRRVHVDDGAALDPARALMSDAKNAATMGAPAQRLGRIAWVQPRDQADDFRRSDVEHGKDRAFAGRQGRQARRQYLRIHVRPPFALVLLGSIAARSAAASSGETRDNPAGLTKVERKDVLVEHMRSSLKVNEPCERRLGLHFRQENVDPSCRFQRPAASGDEHARHDPFAQISRRFEQRQILVEFLVGPRAHDERQMNEALVAHRGDGNAVGGDDLHLPVALPQGERLALLDLDQEPVRVELGDGRFLDERKLFQPFPYFRDIEKQQRIAWTYPGDAKDVLLLEFALARDGHGLDGETQRLGKDVGWFALRGHEGGVVAAFHRAVGAGRREQRQGKASAGARPGQPGEDFMPQARPRLARGRHDLPRGVDFAERQGPGIGHRRRGEANGHALSTIAGGVLDHPSNKLTEFEAGMAASSGTSEVSVIPGWVLTSKTTSSPVPPGESSYRKSVRLTPRQPSVLCATSANSCTFW